MPIRDYGLLVGRPLPGGLVYPHNHGKPPHFKIQVDTGDEQYEVAVNVESVDRSQVLYHLDFAFQPPSADALRDLSPGRVALDSQPGGLALDFVRQRLVTRDQMRLLPLPTAGHGSQLLGAIRTVTEAARNDPNAVLYAFGSNYEDGIHDIHMNQGNPQGNHEEDNGIWQDGAVFLYLPGQQTWIGIFLAFQTQAWDTDDNGDPADS